MSKQTERSKNGKPNGGSKVGYSGSQNGGEKARFINPHFNDADKLRIQDLLPERDAIVCEFMCELAIDFNISIKHDALSGKWNALLLPIGSDHRYAGYILSVRHTDRLMAVFGLVYAHVHKLNGVWPVGDVADDDDWA